MPSAVGSIIATVAVLDYTVVDTALTQMGAVSVPLQTSAPLTQLAPIVAETEPTVLASSIDYIDDAIALTGFGGQERSDSGMGHGPAPKRLVVFDVRPELDDHRDALASATARLADSGIVVETLADVIARGA
uniref:hypothetical protein n=1 Tax=Mycolicibacter algericus TaxID=1288388 RepID=UPI0021F2B036